MFSKRLSRLYKIFTGTCAEGGEELLQLEGRLECSPCITASWCGGILCATAA